MLRKAIPLSAVCAAALIASAAPSALAGEATGNFGTTGKVTPIKDPGVAQSICAFSGQNPERFLDPSNPGYEPGRTQSWGQIPKAYRDATPAFLRPGSSCNGHTGFVATGGTA